MARNLPRVTSMEEKAWWKTLLTYCDGIRSSTGNRTRAALVRDRRATNRPSEHPPQSYAVCLKHFGIFYYPELTKDVRNIEQSCIIIMWSADHLPTTYRPPTDHFFTVQLVQYFHRCAKDNLSLKGERDCKSITRRLHRTEGSKPKLAVNLISHLSRINPTVEFGTVLEHAMQLTSQNTRETEALPECKLAGYHLVCCFI